MHAAHYCVKAAAQWPVIKLINLESIKPTNGKTAIRAEKGGKSAHSSLQSPDRPQQTPRTRNNKFTHFNKIFVGNY